MDKLKKTLTREYNLPFKFNESVVSMILGVVVVLLVGLIAYNYFRTHREVVPTATNNVKTVASEIKTAEKAANTAKPVENMGKIGQGRLAVALPTTHTVAAGENLWVIAEKYYNSGYNYVDLAEANHLPNANQIAAGQQLTIPKVEVRQPVTVAGANVPTVTQSRIDGGSYTVLQGDSLWEISIRAYGDGFKYTQIVTANNLARPNLIHVGNVLKIPQ